MGSQFVGEIGNASPSRETWRVESQELGILFRIRCKRVFSAILPVQRVTENVVMYRAARNDPTPILTATPWTR